MAETQEVRTIGIQEARRHLGGIVDDVAIRRSSVEISRAADRLAHSMAAAAVALRGKVYAALVDVSTYEAGKAVMEIAANGHSKQRGLTVGEWIELKGIGR